MSFLPPFPPTHRAPCSDREAILRECFQAYSDALKRDPSNVHAANGLGAVLAEQGRLEKVSGMRRTRYRGSKAGKVKPLRWDPLFFPG